MEEEWMRDRALLRGLLPQHPQTSPQPLARLTGRSVSWVKQWRQRLVAGDQADPSVLCSRSRAHHAPGASIGRCMVYWLLATSGAQQ
jgi:hypothetical protein